VAIGTDLNGTSPGQWGMYNTGVVEGGGNAANVWKVIVSRWNGSSSTIRLNGSASGSGTVGSGGIAGLRIGSRLNNAFSGADIGEMAIYSSSLSAEDVATLESHLISKWGIDPLFSNVSLLLPFNGNLTDFSPSPKTMTAFGGAAATGAAKYGSASLSLNGSNQYLSTPDSDGFTFSGDFTIESWVQLAALPASGGFAIVQSQGTSYTGDLTYLGFYNDATVGMTLSYTMNTGGNYTGSNFPITASAGQWYHIAMVRSANTMMLYFNGTRYMLLAYVVMPNHVHWLFRPLASWREQSGSRAARAASRSSSAYSSGARDTRMCHST
jgi:hypothetical protein